MGKTGVKEQPALPAICAFAAIIVLVACQSGPPRISIEAVEARLSPAVIGEAMVTMSIRNEGGPDVLSGVRTDIPGAKASLHVMQGERMVSADAIKIPARSGTEFKMGGSHIMIENMPKTVKQGSRINLYLVFQKSGEKQMALTLQAAAPMPMDREHTM